MSGDFSRWLQRVEMVAGLQGVADLARFVLLFLQGEAFDVYVKLTASEQADFTKMKDKLVNTFCMNRFDGFSWLKVRQLQPGKSGFSSG